jgi:parallel beta-helix repeat protein
MVSLIITAIWLPGIAGGITDGDSGVSTSRGSSRATTLYVGTGQTYTTIQSAINAANQNDTIRVYSGIYNEYLTLNTTVSIIGNGSANTTIDGQGSPFVVRIERNYCNISGFRITGSKTGYGGWPNYAGILVNTTYNTISDCEVTGNEVGIYLQYSTHTTIDNCNSDNNNFAGINLTYSNWNTISNSTTNFNYFGLDLTESNGNQIEKNNISNNLGYGVRLHFSKSNKFIFNNMTQNNNSAIEFRTGSCKQNSVFYNNFINNNNGGTQAADYGTNNKWNLTAQGNHWSDWTSPDSDYDGIVDKPYNITGYGTRKDYKPLTFRVSFPGYPPVIKTTNLHMALVGKYYSVNYTATDPDTPQNQLAWNMWTNATWLSFSGTQELYGIPSSNDIGEYWVNIRVSDGNFSDSTNFSLHVILEYPPTINTTNNPVAHVGKYYSMNYTATDPDTPQNSLIWTMNTNASWLSFSANQQLHGTPSSSDNGWFWVNISVSDGNNTDFTNFSLFVIDETVNITYDPVIISQNVLTAYVGKLYIVNYSATDKDTPQNQLVWRLHTNATWLSLGNHTLYGTPAVTDVGRYWVNISVSDGVYRDVTNFTLTVQSKQTPPPPKPPKINTIDIIIAHVGKLYSVNYTATDPDTPQNQLTWNMYTNASWLTFSSGQRLYGTPAKTDVGRYWVYIIVSDGNNTDSTNFTLTVKTKGSVQNRSSPKITTQNVYIAYTGAFYSVDYKATDADTPQNQLTWSMSTNASWLMFSAGHTLFGVPAKSDIGTYWVHISVSDGNAITSTNFTLTVTTKSQNQTTPQVKSTSIDSIKNNVPINNSKIVIKFSHPMNRTAVEAALSISPRVNYTLTWANNDTELIITLNENLSYNTTYIVTIASSAKNSGGHGLNSDFKLLFTTQVSDEFVPVKSKPDDDYSGLLTLIAIISIVSTILIFLLLLSFITRTKRRRLEDVEGRLDRIENGTGDIVVSNGIDEIIVELKREALVKDKPSQFSISQREMLDKFKRKYEKGKISKKTYDSIRKSLQTRK